MRNIFMLKMLVIFPLLLLIVPYADAAPFSDSKVRTGEDPVQLTSDFMTYDREREIYRRQGNVEIIQMDQTLKADVVEYNQRTQVAQATGNVVYTEGGDRLECDFLEINLETRQGLVREGELFYERENFYLYGNQIEKLGENRYRIEKGKFTTCDGAKPSWHFTCREADVTLEGLAKVKGATFRVKDYPLLYFPYFIFPAKTKRQSGLLVPSVGSSSSEGIKLNNAYYWAISSNTDATFYLDLATKKGVGVGGEYRYVTSATSQGRLFGYFIEENSSYQNDKYSQLLDRERERWNIFYEGKKDFDQDLFFRFKMDLVSDRQFYKDYESQTTRRTAERTETSAFLTKHWTTGLSLVGDIEYNKDLLKSNSETVQRYPQIYLTGLPQLVPYTPCYFSFDSAYSNFYREEGVDGSRFDINPRIMLPLRFKKHYLLQTESGFRETAYFDTSDDNGLDDNRGLFYFRTELSTKFMKVYQGKGNSHRKFRHTLEPEIFYSYVSDEEQEDLPLYDEVDRIEEENRIAFAITNRLMGKFFRPDDTSWQRELLFLRLGQFYDATTSDDPFSNSFLEFRSRPTSYCYIKSNLEYDIYDEELEVFNAMVRLEDRRKNFLRFEYRYSKDRIEEIDTSAGFGISKNLGIFFENRKAQHENRTLETIFGLNYHPQCWGTTLTYRIRPGTEGRDQETQIMVEFYLKGVGKVGGFGAGD